MEMGAAARSGCFEDSAATEGWKGKWQRRSGKGRTSRRNSRMVDPQSGRFHAARIAETGGQGILISSGNETGVVAEHFSTPTGLRLGQGIRPRAGLVVPCRQCIAQCIHGKESCVLWRYPQSGSRSRGSAAAWRFERSAKALEKPLHPFVPVTTRSEGAKGCSRALGRRNVWGAPSLGR